MSRPPCKRVIADHILIDQADPFPRMIIQFSLNRIKHSILDLLRRHRTHPKWIIGRLAWFNWSVHVQRCGITINETCIHNQSARIEVYWHRPVIDHHDILALTIYRQSLVIGGLYLPLSPMSDPSSALRGNNVEALRPSAVPVVHGIIVGTPGGNSVSKRANTGIRSLSPNRGRVGGRT